MLIAALLPGGAAEEAGVKVGDRLLALGDLSVTDQNFGPKFRSKFGKEDGAPLPIRVVRGTDTLTLNAKARLVSRLERRLVADPAATPKAQRIRNGILRGTTGGK